MLAARCVQSKFFYLCSCSQKIRSARILANARKDHSSQLRLWNLNSATNNSQLSPRRLGCQIPPISARRTQAPMSSSLIIISHRLFPRRYSNSRHVVESASSSSRRAARAPRRACSHANRLQAHAPWTRVSSQEVFGDLR